jgi:hypothetical protein
MLGPVRSHRPARGGSSFDGHLNHHDVTLLAISRAPLLKIEGFKKRLRWRFPWLAAGAHHVTDQQIGLLAIPEQLARFPFDAQHHPAMLAGRRRSRFPPK